MIEQQQPDSRGVIKMRRYGYGFIAFWLLYSSAFGSQLDCSAFNANLPATEFFSSPISPPLYKELDTAVADKALRSLGNKDFRVIGASDVHKWMSNPIPTAFRASNLYLVRGKRMAIAGDLLLYQKNGQLLVFQGLLGHSDCVRVWDVALVVVAPQPVAKVLYSYSVAE